MVKVADDINEEITKKMADLLARAIDAEIIRGIENYFPENSPQMQYDAKKQQIDAVYLHDVKKKVENLLEKIIDKFNLSPFLSETKRYRLDREKWHESKYKELYDQRKDPDGKYLASGYDYVPVDFEDWTKTYFPDYVMAADIYSNMCEYRRVLKDDLKILNKIARRYIKDDNGQSTD